ncbi:MAG: hypothetical protein SGI83_12285 [Bacteroidota bacterium]|nr:hypothetical protein [Bacteroidota bacterium]
MKKILNNNRLIAIAFFTVFSLAMSPSVMASGIKPAVPVELKFAGLVNEQPVFQLVFAGSPEQDDFTVIIKDEFGYTLYKENIKGENFTKKFLLNTDEIGDNNVRFEIYCNKTKKSVAYDVNRNTRMVQEMVIAEVK